MKKIHLIAAARPNFMKIAPLYHAFAKTDWAEPLIVHTGQHYDINMSEAFFKDLMLPAPHHHLGVGSGSHAEQTGNVMIAYEIWGPAVAEDFFYGFSGWLIFIFGLVVLLVEMWVLNGFRGLGLFGGLKEGKNEEGALAAVPHRPSQTNSPAAPDAASAPVGWKALLHPPQFIVAVMLLAATLAAAQGIEFREKIPPARSFAEFPAQVGEWAGRRDVMEDKCLSINKLYN